MENKIPTASDFIFDNYESDVYAEGPVYSETGYSYTLVQKMLIEFAKLHVEMALIKTSKVAKLLVESGYGRYEEGDKGDLISYTDKVERNYPGHGDCTFEIITIDKESILNSYLLDNIK